MCTVRWAACALAGNPGAASPSVLTGLCPLQGVKRTEEVGPATGSADGQLFDRHVPQSMQLHPAAHLERLQTTRQRHQVAHPIVDRKRLEAQATVGCLQGSSRCDWKGTWSAIFWRECAVAPGARWAWGCDKRQVDRRAPATARRDRSIIRTDAALPTGVDGRSVRLVLAESFLQWHQCFLPGRTRCPLAAA